MASNWLMVTKNYIRQQRGLESCRIGKANSAQRAARRWENSNVQAGPQQGTSKISNMAPKFIKVPSDQKESIKTLDSVPLADEETRRYCTSAELKRGNIIPKLDRRQISSS